MLYSILIMLLDLILQSLLLLALYLGLMMGKRGRVLHELMRMEGDV